MSYSSCIKCSSMVNSYEKYCDDCVEKYNLKQDETWHKRPENWHGKIDVSFELEKDVFKKIDSMINQKRSDENIKWSRTSDISDDVINSYLSKYGPEGLYELSERFTEAANNDVNNALQDALNNKL